MKDIKELHTQLEVISMLHELGPNFFPLRNKLLEDLKTMQADMMETERDRRPRVVTPPAGPASSELLNPQTGQRRQVPDPQLRQAPELPKGRAAQPDADVDKGLRQVPDPENEPGQNDASGTVERRI